MQEQFWESWTITVYLPPTLLIEKPKNAIFSTKKWLSDGKLRQGWYLWKTYHYIKEIETKKVLSSR